MYQHTLSYVQVWWDSTVFQDSVQECHQIQPELKSRVLKQLVRHSVIAGGLAVGEVTELLLKFVEREGRAYLLLEGARLEGYGDTLEKFVNVGNGKVSLASRVLVGVKDWNSLSFEDVCKVIKNSILDLTLFKNHFVGLVEESCYASSRFNLGF